MQGLRVARQVTTCHTTCLPVATLMSITWSDSTTWGCRLISWLVVDYSRQVYDFESIDKLVAWEQKGPHVSENPNPQQIVISHTQPPLSWPPSLVLSLTWPPPGRHRHLTLLNAAGLLSSSPWSLSFTAVLHWTQLSQYQVSLDSPMPSKYIINLLIYYYQ
jgi:hypothetical protein